MGHNARDFSLYIKFWFDVIHRLLETTTLTDTQLGMVDVVHVDRTARSVLGIATSHAVLKIHCISRAVSKTLIVTE